ncbi:dTDP-4-dehydrorhamnose reductase [Thalassotalea sp. HSM 43]|uniref:dTDP-4-dehydrorhamnose reductase n=1 Tax=Thalassotalea sp. HSM 43 TaxID=2552945 RepID=UPI00107FF0AB|nr:dTDP-4-dehydrorhamnose reductase [Thalassotalea sp. HSM 43]QBY03115.1 dTDP-4-dehydrorhamnose reductase [Thalassotalea sp. HSM 43]
MKKFIVIGKSGQLAWELEHISADATNYVSIVCLGRNDIDVLDYDSALSVMREIDADAVINASAYTAVDKAEDDRDNAFALNSTAVGIIAKVCKELGLHFVHVSTDFVFDGLKSSPYLPNDFKSPIGVYGASKSAGEDELLTSIPKSSCIIRTSWVYSVHGNNFVKTMLRLMEDKPELGIISDQIGSPTLASGLARVCVEAAVERVTGTHHYTDNGVASWYDFAVAIQELGLEKGLLSTGIPIKAISTSDYPTPAARPSYSVLDKSSLVEALADVELIHWRKQLSSMLDELKSRIE